MENKKDDINNENKVKEKRCLQCKKLLLDKKLILCPRCSLKDRERAKTVGKVASAVAAVGLVAVRNIEKIKK